MAEVLDLLTELRLGAPGVPEALAAERYVRAAREFLTETRGFRHEPSEWQPQASGEFTFQAPAQTEAFDAVWAFYDNIPLRKATSRYFSNRAGGHPMRYAVANQRLRVEPSGADPAKLRACLVLRPVLGATEIDDAVVSAFGEIIERGALARLLLMPRRPWSDTDLGVALMDWFRKDMDHWRSKAADEGMTGVARQVRYGGL